MGRFLAKKIMEHHRSQFLPALLLHHILNSLRPKMPQEKKWEITKIVGKSKERLLTKAPSPLVLVPSQNKILTR